MCNKFVKDNNQVMEINQIQTDSNLKEILNSPLKLTPAVPTPDWGVSAPPTPVSVSQVFGH